MAETNVQPYATREDVAHLETRLVDRMGRLETTMAERMGQMEVRLIDRIGQMHSSSIKWMAGMLIGHLVAVVVLTVTLIKVIKP